MSAHPLETRMAHLEGAYEQISHRLDSIDGRLGAIEQRFIGIDAGFTGVEGRFTGVEGRFSSLEQKIDRQFLWVVGLLVVSILLPIVDHFRVH